MLIALLSVFTISGLMTSLFILLYLCGVLIVGLASSAKKDRSVAIENSPWIRKNYFIDRSMTYGRNLAHRAQKPRSF